MSGWNSDHETGQDRVTVWQTGGSNDRSEHRMLAQWKVGHGGVAVPILEWANTAQAS